MTNPLNLTPVCMTATTDNTGSATLSLKIPGTFNSLVYSSSSSGRFLKSISIWTQNGTYGDRAHDVQVVDSDSIISGMSGLFPLYPVIQQLGDMGVTNTSTLFRGIFVPPNQVVNLQSIDPSYLIFLPSQLYLTATFTTANATPAGQNVFCNLIWGTASSNS